MKVSKWWLIFFLLGLVLWQKSSQAQASATTQLSTEAQQFLASLPEQWLSNDGELWVEGEILVGHRADQTVASSSRMLTGIGYRIEKQQSLRTTDSAGKAIEIERWRVPVGSEWAMIATLQNQPDILFAEPNWVVRASDASSINPNATATSIPTAIPTLPPTVPPTITPTVTPKPSPTITPATTTTATITVVPSASSYFQPYVPNDSFYLDNQWYLQRINVPRALALLDNGKGSVQPAGEVVVAIIDSGIDLSHPEFQGRVLPGFNFWDNSSDPDTQNCTVPTGSLAPMIDDFGHGTHVAGLIGAALNNRSGIASVAPFVKIQPLKILNGSGSGTVYDLATAITYAANCLHVQVINLSLEISASVLDNNPLLNDTLHTAVQEADAKDILLIAAGGNSGGTMVPYPAAYPEVIGVSALNINNQRTSYSTTGSQIDIAAPGGESATNGGVRIYSTWSIDAIAKCRDGSYQAVNGGSYCNDHGTSMATPLVAGVAAMVRGVRPDLNAQQVRDLLLQTATRLDLPSDQVGAGRVDAHAALRRALYSNLTIIHDNYFVQSPVGQTSIPLSIRLENVSLQPLVWTANVISDSNWVSLNTVGKQTLTETNAYAAPSFVQVILSPAQLSVGEHDGIIRFNALSSSGNPIKKEVKLRLLINPSIQQVTVAEGTTNITPTATLIPANGTVTSTFAVYLPLIFAQQLPQIFLPIIAMNATLGAEPTATPSPTPSPATPTPTPTTATPTPLPTAPAATAPAVSPAAIDAPFQWEIPVQASDRVIYTATTSNSTVVSFPTAFHFLMRGQIFNDFRVFEDGYITFPASETSSTESNRCLLNLEEPGQAIYGWWSDLTRATTGSQISGFMPNTDRFVVEFSHLSAVGSAQPYQVSFQIVMYSNGDIRLNYLNAPSFSGKPSPVTIGVEAKDALFGFQIACNTATEVIGTLPQSGQSYLIKAGYLF